MNLRAGERAGGRGSFLISLWDPLRLASRVALSPRPHPARGCRPDLGVAGWEEAGRLAALALQRRAPPPRTQAHLRFRGRGCACAEPRPSVRGNLLRRHFCVRSRQEVTAALGTGGGGAGQWERLGPGLLLPQAGQGPGSVAALWPVLPVPGPGVALRTLWPPALGSPPRLWSSRPGCGEMPPAP